MFSFHERALPNVIEYKVLDFKAIFSPRFDLYLLVLGTVAGCTSLLIVYYCSR